MRKDELPRGAWKRAQQRENAREVNERYAALVALRPRIRELLDALREKGGGDDGE